MQAYFTIAVVVLMMLALVFELAGADFVLAAALFLLMIFGIVTPGEAVIGFSNKGMLTVAILFIVSLAMRNTGALDVVAKSFLRMKKKASLPSALLRMMVPVSGMSAFLNNTPIVVMLVPVLKKWAEKIDVPASKVLIPLSYAAIFGGVCTLIGTSTNLVVHGLMLENGIKGISMFELAKVGLPCAFIGWIYIAFFGQRILPDRKDMLEVVGENRKEYVVEMKVQKGCKLIGKTIREAGLRNLKGLFLLEIERGEKMLGPVSSDEIIEEDDRLMFVGITSAIVELQDIRGLVPVAQELSEKDFKSMQPFLVEAVISSSSPVLGKTIKECNFRSKYGAGVIAVHRNGERIKSKIGSIQLKPGDTLLLFASDEFLNNWKNSQDFYLISTVKEVVPKAHNKGYIALAILALMIAAATFGKYLPKIGGSHIGMFHSAFGAAILLVLTGCVRLQEIKQSIRLDVLVTIACAFGISKALQNSGAATMIAGCIINSVKVFGAVGVLAGVYLMTSIFTEIITNNAAAALIFPIAFSAGIKLGVDPRPFFIAIAIGASASFATPIGYQTNLIVQGAGGYKFSDYLKIGVILNILFFITAVAVIPLFWKF